MSFEFASLEALDIATRGEVVKNLVESAQDTKRAQQNLITAQEKRVLQVVKDIGEISANRNLGGFRAEYEVPLFADAYWRAKFAQEDFEAGRTKTENPWDHKDFTLWWKKRNPDFVYKEAKKGNSILVPATKWTRVKEAAAAA